MYIQDMAATHIPRGGGNKAHFISISVNELDLLAHAVPRSGTVDGHVARSTTLLAHGIGKNIDVRRPFQAGYYLEAPAR
jgi:hypothetical protein